MSVITDYYTKEEKAVVALRDLFEKFGYRKFKMSRFEEYELYSKNKNFLENDNIITITDLNGKLLALKPDVTLSIVKNTLAGDNDFSGEQKVYYNEDVFRGDTASHEIKTIMQVGIEHIGNIDLYSTAQTLYLAKESLKLIDADCILDISHQGYISGLLKDIDEAVKNKLVKLISEKNAHEILRIAAQNGISDETAKIIADVSLMYGPIGKTIELAKKYVINDEMKLAVAEIEAVYNVLKSIGESDNVNLDFSIINDMSYYNGIIFQGYVRNVPYYILSGGRYDKLIEKMGGKKLGAIGFAVYLDLIDMYSESKNDYDCDVLVIYNAKTDVSKVLEITRNYANSGKRIMTSVGENSAINAKETIDLRA